MSDVLRLRVLEGDKVTLRREFTNPVELGRQRDNREELYSATKLETEDGRWRVVLARPEEDTVSRRHALLDLKADVLHLRNVSNAAAIGLPDGTELRPGGTCELPLPASLKLGNRTIEIESVGEGKPVLNSLPDVALPPVELSLAASRFPTIGFGAINQVELANLMRWLQSTMAVLQAAASSSDFFQRAAQAVVDIIGLHSGRVLLLEEDRWKPVAVRTAPRVVVDTSRPPSRNVLDRVRAEKRTFWLAPSQAGIGPTESLVDVEFVVAAPILGHDGEVIGALYGDCRDSGQNIPMHPITPLGAMLVEMLASGVASGLARLEKEKAALEADIRFSQFFTPELSRQLALQPDLLEGRDSEVSILFCDVRAFSRLCEHLAPSLTVEWIGDVMGTLSECVLKHRGVLVDYIGDELMAMWGAPEEQPDHARLACQAALDMLDCVPKLNERWEATLGEPMVVGIGINSGRARIGNTGSRHKFKYGPLGNTVNLASRVQGATKPLRTGLLITESTRAQLGDGFSFRRLGKVRVRNIECPVNLYELVAQDRLDWTGVRDRYEKALEEFEQGHFRPAARILHRLLAEHPEDGPALVLALRTMQCLVQQPTDVEFFDPTWELPGK